MSDEAPDVGSDSGPETEWPEGLSEADRSQIETRGLTVDDVAGQLRWLRHEPPAIHLDRPCTLGDGIVQLSSAQHTALQDRFQAAAAAGRFAKFVPASGAATRMFRSLLVARDSSTSPTAEGEELAEVQRFLDEIDRFPFYGILAEILRERGRDLQELVASGDFQPIVQALLDEPAADSNHVAPALGYGTYPKALIPCHVSDNAVRTALDEHVEEAAEHLRSDEGVCMVHFTIPKHRELEFREAFRDVAGRLEARLGGRYELSCSIQRPATDTIAVGLDGEEAGQPVRDRDGKLLFRPGGHGALLPNLRDVATDTGADLVFVRTIDNILPADRRREVLLWNRLLGGYLLELEAEIVDHLGALERAERAGSLGEAEVDAGLHFAADRLFLAHARDYLDRPLRVKHAWLVDQLDRPLRVCGMVENEGEPGGGPFWVSHSTEGADDAATRPRITPQIVEQAQVDSSNSRQVAIAGEATHFNPVILVCRLRSHRGDVYDLDSFVDPGTVFLSTKSHQGRPIRVLERPGLWNGAMSRWNTIFVEVPAAIFAPIKTVFDLLRPAHQPASSEPTAR